MAGVREARIDSTAHGVIHLRVIGDDQRVLTTQLGRIAHETTPHRLAQDLARCGGSREHQEVTLFGDCGTHNPAGSSDYLNEVAGQPGVEKKFEGQQRGKGVLESGLATTALPASSAGMASPMLSDSG